MIANQVLPGPCRKTINSRNMQEVAARLDLERVIPAELGLEKGSPESVQLANGIRQLYFDGGDVTRNGYWNVSYLILH